VEHLNVISQPRAGAPLPESGAPNMTTIVIHNDVVLGLAMALSYSGSPLKNNDEPIRPVTAA
jgi:hypothetical protein